MVKLLDDCRETEDVPNWMVENRIVLTQKDARKGNAVGNYRPIAGLNLLWKLLTGIVNEKFYDHLNQQNLLPEEQKDRRRRTRGTKDQLLIDKAVVRNSRRRKTNLNVTWIYFRKAYDMMPHSWILKALELVGRARIIIELLKRSMQSWRTILFSGKNKLGKVNIRRGIFQGDSLSPLLFVVALIPVTIILRTLKQEYSFGKRKERLNHLLFMDDLKLYGSNDIEIDSLVEVIKIVSGNIGMQFGIDKCDVLKMKRGQQVHCEGIDFGDGTVIEEADGEGYKYLGILGGHDTCQEKMKDKVQKEYYKRVRAVLNSNLNGGNVTNAINIWAVATVLYGTGIIIWNKGELDKIERQKRKLLNMHRCLHPRSSVDRSYISRAQGGRGLLSAKDCVELERSSLFDYATNNNERLLKAATEELQLRAKIERNNKDERENERQAAWKEKGLHGQFLRETEGKQDNRRWQWLKAVELKRQTESLVCTAQEQALRTNAIETGIDH